MNRVDIERQYWETAAESENIRDEWICDKNVTDEQCLEAVMRTAPQEFPPPATVVEIGSGIGRLTEMVAEFYPNSVIVGMDISEKMTAIADSNSTHANCHYYTCEDCRSLYVGNRMANFVYSMATFQHIDADGVKAYIKEAYRVLREGGKFRFQYVEGDEQEPFSIHYSEAQMIEWLQAAGFEVKTIDRGLIFPQWTWITAGKPKEVK